MNTEIIAQFQTKLEGFELQNNEIQVSGDMSRIELTQLINQLLQQENENQEINEQQFDFFINNQLLIGTLNDHLIQHQISTEKTLIIQYMIAQREPKLQNTSNTNDWIIKIMLINDNILLGLSNGQIVICNSNGKKLQTLLIKKCIAKTYAYCQNYIIVIFWDNSISYLQFNNLNIDILLEKQGISGECVSFNKKNPNNFCIGDAEGNLIFYQLIDQDIKQISNYKIHTQQISQCKWLKQSLIITGSYDHSIIMFNLKTNTISKQIFTKDSIITDLHYLSQQQQILSTHEDGYIKLWDCQSENVFPVRTFKSSTSLLTSISVNALNQMIVSSFDGNVYYWDLRSEHPLYTMKGDQKILDCCWGEQQILFGGADKKLYIYKQ